MKMSIIVDLENYPPGAEHDSNAPWNEKEEEEVMASCRICGCDIYENEIHVFVNNVYICELCRDEILGECT